MDEEKKTTPAEQPQPPAPLSDARKAALLRYMAILFAVAFLLVLLSLILQTHSSKSTISELSAASTSALENLPHRHLGIENLPVGSDHLDLHIADLNQLFQLSAPPAFVRSAHT